MSNQILDEIEYSPNDDISVIEEKVRTLLQKTKKAALIAAAGFGAMLVGVCLRAAKITHYPIIAPLLGLGFMLMVIMGLVCSYRAYQYGEQASILSTRMNGNKVVPRYFFRFLGCLAVLVVMIGLWIIFENYRPVETVLAQFDGNEMVEVPAKWWRPYKDFIILMFITAALFWALSTISVLCLHTHEKTLSTYDVSRIREIKFRQLLLYCGILAVTVALVVSVENNISLRRQYRAIARVFSLRREEITVSLILFLFPLCVAHLILYFRKPKHL